MDTDVQFPLQARRRQQPSAAASDQSRGQAPTRIFTPPDARPQPLGLDDSHISSGAVDRRDGLPGDAALRAPTETGKHITGSAMDNQQMPQASFMQVGKLMRMP